MKKKDRYKLLNYAKKQYAEAFDLDLQFKHLSKRDLYNLLKAYKHSTMCEWWYCCHGLYQSCWQEPIEAGCWNFTQETVDDIIRGTIDDVAKACRKDNRILYCELQDRIDVIIVARDICSADYLISFTNEEE